MTPTEYVAEIRKCADILERLGVVPILDEVPSFQLRYADFERVFAGETVRREDGVGNEHLRIVVDGIKFTTCRPIPTTPTDFITLPKEPPCTK